MLYQQITTSISKVNGKKIASIWLINSAILHDLFFLNERMTGIEPAPRREIQSGTENLRATITLHPHILTL